MRQVKSLSHTRWECKYHIVFIPKYRRKVLFGQIRRELTDVFHSLARQREKRDPHSSNVFGKEKEFRGSAFLGERIFCLDGRSR